VILDAGIDVLSTMNLQHLESLNDQMFQITGVKVRETVPDWVITEADEVVMVDLTPEALINRIKRGVVYDRKKAEQALNNFFKESKLSALRELPCGRLRCRWMCRRIVHCRRIAFLCTLRRIRRLHC
jgi:two-component system sensor histidine kinase KdpD